MRRNALKLWAVFVFQLLCQATFSQERQLGTWKMFLPYGVSYAVCDAGDKIYSAAAKSIFSYEKSTGAIRTYDKSSGLSDIGIKTMSYDPSTGFLAVAYTNNNLDFIQNGTDVYNIPDIKLQSSTGAIAIYDISFHNGAAYISSDLGVSVVDLAKMDIYDTYVIGSNGGQVSVYSTSFDSANIYAATSEGVKHASLSSPALQDYNSWTLFDSAQNLPARAATLVRAFNNRVYAVIPTGHFRDTLYQFNGAKWTPVFSDSIDSITSLNVVNGNLYFTVWSSYGGAGGRNGKIDASDNLTIRATQDHVMPVAWLESNGFAWESDYWSGLFMNNEAGYINQIIPDGPFSSNVFGLNSTNGVLNVAPGGVDDGWDNAYNGDGFFIYNGSRWTNINQYNNPSLANWLDILCVTAAPSTGKTYFGSYWAGLVEYDNASKTIKQYDKTNSMLEHVIGDTNRTKISALTTDANGNVWIGNAGAASVLKVIKPDGTWQKFNVPFQVSELKRMLVDENNQVWVPSRIGYGLMVFAYGGDLSNPHDTSVLLQSGVGAGGLPSNNVFAIAEDHTGNIWVGTDAGIGTYYCASSVFQGGCDATQIKVTLDGYVGYLFGMQTTHALAVDAANRIWVGTTEGLWLISNDGQTTYDSFTVDNSPLPNNQITDITIDKSTGEVFIGTIGGLVSFQGDAVDTCIGCKEALVYPNPVKRDYSGPIAIKGLVDNAYVKITDVSGALIFQGTANGTQMIWNGKGYDGQRAKTGVYLVFSSSSAGKERRVGKILITD